MKIEEIRADRLDSGGTTIAIEKLAGKSMPWSNAFPTTDLELHYHAIANFVRTFEFRQGDRLVFLTDKLLDPRVVPAITGLAWRAIEAVSDRALSIAGWCFLAMTALICFDIVARRMSESRALGCTDLDQLYARLSAGPIPDGPYDGDLIFPKGESGDRRLAEIVGGVPGLAVELKLHRVEDLDGREAPLGGVQRARRDLDE